MNHSIVGTNNITSLTSQQKGFDQNISENVSTVSSKKSKAFKKFKSTVNSFMQFIYKYLIDKHKNFFTCCKRANEKQKTDIKEVEQNNIPDVISMDENAYILHKLFAEFHTKRIHYSFSSMWKGPQSREIVILKINQSPFGYKQMSYETLNSQDEKHTDLSKEIGLDKRTIEKLYGNGDIIDIGIMYDSFFYGLPSYVGVIKDENYKFLQGENIHAHINDIQDIEVEYNGENHILHDTSLVARGDKPVYNENLNCVLYATKEEAEKAIKEAIE